MAALRDRLGGEAEPAGDLGQPMTSEQARGLPSRWIDVGGHGRSHTPLTRLSSAEAADEIVGGRSDLETLTGAPVEGFAYPHGEWNTGVRQAVIEAGFAWALTTRSAVIGSRNTDVHAIPRLPVANVGGAALLRAMRNGRAA
jgi:peptidoglycan/xylan/chitin deacetylase (PgdA/CDA1 family)